MAGFALLSLVFGAALTQEFLTLPDHLSLTNAVIGGSESPPALKETIANGDVRAVQALGGTAVDIVNAGVLGGVGSDKRGYRVMAEAALSEGELVFTTSERGAGLATLRAGKIISLFEPTDAPLSAAPAGALMLAPSQHATGPRFDGVRLLLDEAGRPVSVGGRP